MAISSIIMALFQPVCSVFGWSMADLYNLALQTNSAQSGVKALALAEQRVPR